jgi:hypothetical protein
MLRLPAPVSGGLLLSYRCSSRCRHCMYACGADWRPDCVDIRKHLVRQTDAFRELRPREFYEHL